MGARTDLPYHADDEGRPTPGGGIVSSNGWDQERAPGLPARIVAHVRRDVLLVLLDAVISVAAFLVPLVLRFEGRVPPQYWVNFWTVIPFVIVFYLLINRLFGL